jgi:hypothetical protein
MEVGLEVNVEKVCVHISSSDCRTKSLYGMIQSFGLTLKEVVGEIVWSTKRKDLPPFASFTLMSFASL